MNLTLHHAQELTKNVTNLNVKYLETLEKIFTNLGWKKTTYTEHNKHKS